MKHSDLPTGHHVLDLMVGDPESSFERPQDKLDFANEDANEFAPFRTSVFDTLSGWGTSGPAGGMAGAAFNPGSAAHGALPGAGAEITLIDSEAAARASKPGGGGGSGGGGVLTDYFSGSANGSAGYDIWLQFKGSGWTTQLEAAFIKAADYFTSVITADIGGGGYYRGQYIDDLYVTAELVSIDGQGGILGQAGPTAVWTATELTAAGQMQFDIADALNYLGKGLWDDIVTHELMHVLGFGSLWNYGTNPLVSGNQYTGAQGLSAYQQVHPGAQFVPVEDEGGPGTAGAHWDEQALNNELMTGYINDDGNPATLTDNYLAKFSVMSLADLGYQVAYKDYPYDGQVIA